MPPFNDHVADLADDYVHRLLNANRAAEVERHCAACPACQAAVDDARRRLDALRAEPPAEASEKLVRKTIGRIDAHQKGRQRRWRLFLAGAGGLLAASVVVLVWLHVYYFNLAATPYDLVVLGQRQLLASADGSLRVVLRDAKTLAPVVGVSVAVRLVGRDNKQTADLAAFQTDADGGGDPRFTLPDWADQACDLIVQAQTAGGLERNAQGVELKRSFKVMLSTDKPVYQPGQTIHTRALALRRPNLHPVAGQAATFSVVDPKGNIVFRQEGKTSRYGITAADCPLDTEILEGPYTVLCKTGDVESRLSVDVKKYVLPKFKVTVALDRPFYKPGDTIKLAVQADYFFGKPVADATVDMVVREDLGAPPPAHTILHTDGKGTATWDYVVQKAAWRQPLQRSPETSHIHFQATVTDAAGQKQAASTEPAVSDWPAHIEVIPEAGELVQDVDNKVYVLVTLLDGRPAAGAHVHMRKPQGGFEDEQTDENGAAVFDIHPSGIQRAGPDPAKGQIPQFSVTDDKGAEIAERSVLIPCGPAGDFLVRTDRAVYRGGDTLTLTAVGGGSGAVFVDFIKDGQTMRTDTVEMVNGQGQAAVDLPADLSGTVQVVAYRLDVKGYPVRKTRVVYVRPADEIHIAATLDPGKTAYKPGDRPTLHLKLTDKNGRPSPGAVSLDGVDDAVFSVLPQRPGMEEAFYTLEEDLMAPVNRIHPWSPKDAGSQRFQEALFAAASRADNPPQANAGPPIPGEAMKAARAGRPRVLGDALPMAPLGTTHSLVAETYQAKVQETAKVRQAGLGLMNWLWLLLIPAAIGVTILGFWLFGQSSVLVKSLVTGYVVIPLALVGLVAVFWRGEIDLDRLQVLNGRVSEPLSFAAATGEPMAEGRAMPMMAPQAPPGAADVNGPGQGGGAAPRVRQLFPETLLWRPELITDDVGDATLPLDLADSITTWRISASAVSADGELGAAQLPVKVFQDFFVDLNLPVALTRGDEVGVPVVVYNYLDKPQTVTLALADDKEKWFTRLDGAEQRLNLGPHEVRSVRYRLKVEKVGAWTLTVKAQGAADGDAVQRPIEVLPDGRRVEQVVNGTLDKPADVALNLPEDHIPGSAKAFVKIYPSSFSQLVDGLDNIFQMPGGCFEQTSSTTYPNLLAFDYLKRTGQNSPAVRAKAEGYIRYGYQRLLGFEARGGGFEWFGHAPANRTLTAYGLMEFMDMARVQDVDPNMVARTRNWLLAQRRPDGSWDADDNPMLHEDLAGGRSAEDARLAETAYIAWAVFGDPGASGQAVATFNYLKGHAPETIRDAHTLALVCNALLAADEHDADAAPYLDRLESMKHFDAAGKFAWWEQPAGARTTFYGAGRSGEVETTALATLALVRAGRNPDTTRKVLAWLTSQKDPKGTWYSTQATVLALKALLAGTGKPLGGDAERVVELRLDGELIDTVRIPADQADVLKQVDLSARLKPGKQVLTVSEAHGSAIGFQASFRYNVPEAGPAARQDPLAVDLSYDRTELAVNDQVQATAKVRNATDRPMPMVMVELPVPPGFAPSADDFAALVKPGGKVAKYQMGPRSVLLYLTGLDKGETLTAPYHLRATMPVKAAAAGARVYEYYDPDARGSSPETRFTVQARD